MADMDVIELCVCVVSPSLLPSTEPVQCHIQEPPNTPTSLTPPVAAKVSLYTAPVHRSLTSPFRFPALILLSSHPPLYDPHLPSSLCQQQLQHPQNYRLTSETLVRSLIFLLFLNSSKMLIYLCWSPPWSGVTCNSKGCSNRSNSSPAN